MARVPFLSRLLVLAMLACSAAGCALLHARAIGPALETPAPPPRTVPTAAQPIEGQPIVTSTPVEVPATAPPAITPPSAPTASATPTPTPAPAPAQPTPPPAPTPPPPTEPPPTLTTANPAAAEQRTRAALANANRDLARIDARTLSSDARAQYDLARRFVTQANEALNMRNFEFAQQLADKAATLAALLPRR